MVKFFGVQELVRLLRTVGVEEFLSNLIRYTRDDYLRWPKFEKSPRLASHSADGVIELDPGAYFENHVDGDAFDIPWKIWVSFPLKKDKIFGVIGAGGSINSNPIAAPGGGLIWLFTDHLRLEGVFPKPALVYNPNDDWEFRIAGNLFYESYRTDDVITPARKLQVHDPVVSPATRPADADRIARAYAA